MKMQEFWSSQRVLVTGHTGFKGAWLTYWLHRLGATICGIGLQPETTPNLFSLLDIENRCESNICDIRNKVAVSELVTKFNPTIVFHLAAQPLVRLSYQSPAETFDTNVMGTVNVLDSLRNDHLTSLKSIVVITTDKVYDNQEWYWAYREIDPLGGKDPYSASKAACELVVNSYRTSFFERLNIPLSTARAGNVIGGGDWSIDRLIPDAMKSWNLGEPVKIRNPSSVRPWQHVLDPLYGYLRLAEKTASNLHMQGAYNFSCSADHELSVGQVVELAKSFFGDALIEVCDEENRSLKESNLLTLDSSKARNSLNIKSLIAPELAIKWAVNWYKDFYQGLDPIALCDQQIAVYEKKLIF